MCGFTGIWGQIPEKALSLTRSLDCLSHRGPDGYGWHFCNQSQIGHRRLSILGGTGGAQPLYDESGDIGVIYNGEIYNHMALRGLLGRRHDLNTGSDGEVIAHLYEEEGPDFVRMLKGMFALAVVERGHRLVLARDPMGIKPLYWARHQDQVMFSSEMKALLELCPPECIENFPPGHLYVSDQGLRAYAPRDPVETVEADEATWERRLLAELDRAVRRRLMADGRVGVFLSGGLDSSLVAALAARRVKGLPTFAVGVPGSPDLERAREVAAALGTEHHEALLDPDQVRRALPEILHHLESYDPDLVASAVPCWFVSQLAARHLKVVLTGEGADELFAGYAYHSHYRDRPEALQVELDRLLDNLHRINLQRVDRMSMAHGLEARVPFLDTGFIRLARNIPMHLKLGPEQQKLILRRAAAHLLPESIAWRPKAQFDEGSGARGLLAGVDLRALFLERFPPELERLVACWEADRV